MNNEHTPISAVDTNVITGFLGVGKTSAILNLLKHKPRDERWAVLVNEFGEIGVDGSLFVGQSGAENEVFIREVPGGCMCCTSGLPMHIALNQLLIKARPHRLLIEPTGLGHPLEVLQALSAEHYQGVLSLKATVTLVDARKLADAKYADHATFKQQLAIADMVVGNKSDLYQAGDQQRLCDYVKHHVSEQTPIVFTQQGEFDVSLLQSASAHSIQTADHHHHAHGYGSSVSDGDIPDSGYVVARNQGEGYHSIGWRFSADKVFDHAALFAFLNSLSAERMKGVFITDQGVFAYNLTTDALTEIELDDAIESRIEIIAQHIDDNAQTDLLACLLK